MRTKQEYIEGLSKMKRNIYHNGQLIDRTDELQMDCLNTIGTTYDEAAKPENQDLCTAISHLTGERINRFNHIHQNKDDLHKKQDMTRMLCQKSAGASSAAWGSTNERDLQCSYEADKVNSGATKYHENFKKWLIRFQTEDLIGCCAQTDVKGDRMLRPADQPNPGAYVRIKERLKDGIIVDGCKVHISEASVADEILVLPPGPCDRGQRLRGGFRRSGRLEGLKQVVTIHNLRRGSITNGIRSGATDSYLISTTALSLGKGIFGRRTSAWRCLCTPFCLFHRHSYSGCKPAIGDVILGMAALAAEVNNIHKQSHVREKLAELIMTIELGYAADTRHPISVNRRSTYRFRFCTLRPRSFIPNSIYCNVGRCSRRAVWREAEILCDLAGGVVATFPTRGTSKSGHRRSAPQIHQAESEHVG